MYLSSLVRSQSPFFSEGLLHEDSEKCMEILQNWDFGFVHQVLSFLRTDNLTNRFLAVFVPTSLEHSDRYIIVQRYAPLFLERSESLSLRNESKRTYYRVLAKEALRFATGLSGIITGLG